MQSASVGLAHGPDDSVAAVATGVGVGGGTTHGPLTIPTGHRPRHDDHCHDHDSRRHRPGDGRRPCADPHQRTCQRPDNGRNGGQRAQGSSLMLRPPGGEFVAALQLQLPEHVRDVVLDRVEADAEACGDLGVRAAFAQLVQDTPLGRRQDVGVARATARIALHVRHRRAGSARFSLPGDPIIEKPTPPAIIESTTNCHSTSTLDMAKNETA